MEDAPTLFGVLRSGFDTSVRTVTYAICLNPSLKAYSYASEKLSNGTHVLSTYVGRATDRLHSAAGTSARVRRALTHS